MSKQGKDPSLVSPKRAKNEEAPFFLHKHQIQNILFQALANDLPKDLLLLIFNYIPIQYCAVFGGFSSTYVTTCELLDDNNNWIPLPELPESRYNGGVVYQDGKVYLIGGSNSAQCTVLDLIAKKWLIKTSMKRMRSNFGIWLYQNQIYVFFGGPGAEFYNIETDTWKDLPRKTTRSKKPPKVRTWFASTSLHDKFFILGGLENDDKNSTGCESYNPKLQKWEQHISMNLARHGALATSWKHYIYVFGGQDGNKIIHHYEIYDSILNTWTLYPWDYLPRAYGIALTIGDLIYITGGDTPKETPSKECFFFNPIEKEFKLISPMLQSRALHMSCIVEL